MAAATKKYIEGIGRRKEAVARVRITPGTTGAFVVNDRELVEYFPLIAHQLTSKAPLLDNELQKKFTVSAHVKGGGISAQAEAIRLGIARALVKHDSEMRGDLKAAGYLKRDPRVKERKKFGLKKARKAAQWSKR